MSKALRVAAVVIALSGCAEAPPPQFHTPPARAYAAAAGNGQQVDAEDPGQRRTEPSAQPYAYMPPPRTPPSCRVTDVDESFVDVACEYAGEPTPAEWNTGLRLEYARAAAAAAVSGRDYIARLSFEITPRTASGQTPVQCVTTTNARKVLGNVLRAMGNNQTGRVDMHCSSYGYGTNCSGTVREPDPPAPMVDPHETTCVGGETYTVVSGTSTDARFRFLTAAEAEAAVARGVPEANRPVAVQFVLQHETPATAAKN